MGNAGQTFEMRWVQPILLLALIGSSILPVSARSAVTNRFLSADPLGHAASMDLYSYCNGDPVNGYDPDGRLAAKGAAEFESAASTGYQDAILGAYAAPAIIGNSLSGGQWAQPADDQHVTANQMYYQFVMGTGPVSNTRTFDQTSVLGQQMIQSDYVQTGAQNAGASFILSSAYNQNPSAPASSVYTGRSLGDLNPLYYAAVDFPNDVVLGNNPARGLQGTITGLTAPLGLSTYNGQMSINVDTTLADKLSASSATHLPPMPIIGYGHSLLGNNTFGPNGPMHTITTYYNLNFNAPLDTSKIPAPNVTIP